MEETGGAEDADVRRLRSSFHEADDTRGSIDNVLKGEGEEGEQSREAKTLDLNRPTYIKVHRKHLSRETLDLYELPWEWDSVSFLSITPCSLLQTDSKLEGFELPAHQKLDSGI